VLGKPGGYGITYLAWDLTLQTTAAIKEYLPQRLASRKPGDTEISLVSVDDAAVYKEGLEEFLDEARTLVRFSHPNIVRIRDFFSRKIPPT
jgi:serine/threonine protein kinase